MEETDPPASPSSARFNDRLVAFALDLLLVLLAYYGLTFAVARGMPGLLARPAVTAAWPLSAILLFIFYHALLGSGGRQTAGKALMGITVLQEDGSDLSFGWALGRALGYLLGTAGVGLGFLWALGAEGKAWHDKISGTLVVETREKGAAARLASLAASWVLGPAMAFSWVWVLLLAPLYAQAQLVANAQIALKAIAQMDQAYRARTGAYATDLDSLLKISGREAEFKENLARIVDMSTLKLEGSTQAYSVQAVALDEHRTLVTVHNAP